MNNNKPEILVFGKTDKTALEGRIVRAHNGLAYCWLFCYLTFRPIIRLLILYFFPFYLYICSHRPVGWLLQNFASWSEVAVVLTHWHQIPSTPARKILNAKSWTKIWHLVRPKLSQFLAVLEAWGSVVSDFYSKSRFCLSPRCLSHFASKLVEGVWPAGGWNKKSHRDSNSKDVSLLAQGLNYRSVYEEHFLSRNRVI